MWSFFIASPNECMRLKAHNATKINFKFSTRCNPTPFYGSGEMKNMAKTTRMESLIPLISLARFLSTELRLPRRPFFYPSEWLILPGWKEGKETDSEKRSRQVLFLLICQAKFTQGRTKKPLIVTRNLFHHAWALDQERRARKGSSLALFQINKCSHGGACQS